ncbi:MAG TPA: hypothetical protein VK817_10090 [Trebonia sp.]|nr:hypothetical protein [Trebonia sp.]
MLITRLPGLGTTWYERRFAYWCRRLGAVLLLAIAVVVYALIIAGVVRAAGAPGSPGFLAVAIAEIVFTIVTGILSFRHLWRLGITGRALRRNRAADSAGVGAGLVAFWTGGAGAALLLVGALLTAGFALAAFAIWLTPVPPAERYARQRMDEDLRVRQHAPLHGPGRGGQHKRKR